MATDWHSEETYKGLIQLAVSGLRFGALVNGGAAVALLALIGNLYGNGVPVPEVQVPMTCFIIGIVSAGLAHVGAYLTQLRLYQESALNVPEDGPFQHGNFLYAALGLVILSIVLFGWGAYAASAAIAAGPP